MLQRRVGGAGEAGPSAGRARAPPRPLDDGPPLASQMVHDSELASDSARMNPVFRLIRKKELQARLSRSGVGNAAAGAPPPSLLESPRASGGGLGEMLARWGDDSDDVLGGAVPSAEDAALRKSARVRALLARVRNEARGNGGGDNDSGGSDNSSSAAPRPPAADTGGVCAGPAAAEGFVTADPAPLAPPPPPPQYTGREAYLRQRLSAVAKPAAAEASPDRSPPPMHASPRATNESWWAPTPAASRQQLAARRGPG
eukprot:177646-Chlamydomonas_euryale.AAC.1